MPPRKKRSNAQLNRIEALVVRQRENPSVDSEQLTRIEHKLFGNGSEGLLMSFARMQENLEALTNSLKASSDCNEKNIANIAKLTDAVDKLNIVVDSHIKSVHLNNLMQKRWFWGILFIGIILVNSLSTYVPNLLNAFFTWAGIPFQLPLT
jgi:hypothetical protein